MAEITVSSISDQTAIAKCTWLLDDRRIESTGIIGMAGLTTLKK